MKTTGDELFARVSSDFVCLLLLSRSSASFFPWTLLVLMRAKHHSEINSGEVIQASPRQQCGPAKSEKCCDASEHPE